MNAASLEATSKGRTGNCVSVLSKYRPPTQYVYPSVPLGIFVYSAVSPSRPEHFTPGRTTPRIFVFTHACTRAHTHTRPHMVGICADSAIFSTPIPRAYARHKCVIQTHICVRRKWLFTCRVHFANYVHSRAAAHAWKTITYEDTYENESAMCTSVLAYFALFIGKIQFARMLPVMAERRRSLLEKIRSGIVERTDEKKNVM